MSLVTLILDISLTRTWPPEFYAVVSWKSPHVNKIRVCHSARKEKAYRMGTLKSLTDSALISLTRPSLPIMGGVKNLGRQTWV